MKIFLDIGAWQGDTTQSVLNSGFDFDKIYCFEPQLHLCQIIKNHNWPQVTVCEFGLWHKNCDIPLFIDANKTRGCLDDGASLYPDKFQAPTIISTVKMVNASEWFEDNLSSHDNIVMKMNCEGAECDILENLIRSGQFKKISALMVDFDVRKVPSQTHREAEIRKLLESFDIPMHFVDRYDQWRLRGQNSTHYWMKKIL